VKQILSNLRAKMAEDQIQGEIVSLFKVALRDDCFYFHVPNGGKRSINEARKFKTLGVIAGVPDLVIIDQKGMSHFLEVKTAHGSLSNEQKAFRDKCFSRGIRWALVRSREDAQHIVNQWGLLSNGENDHV
jgi:hypothetical protein